MNQLDMKGRNAVVTGGAAGIGLAIASRLIASGARVSVWDRDAAAGAKAADALKSGTHSATLDVADESQVRRALDETLTALGKVDILVCSAGITGPNLKVRDYPIEEWQAVLDINLTGVFLCNKTIAPHMEANKYGRIVNIASVAGKEGNPNASAYSASKAGVIALTKSLGKELAQTNVKVNCVTPAAVKTGMFSQMTPEFIQFMLSKIPMGRFGEPDEIAALVCWLCSEDCSFSTAATFDLSGGRATY
ncbi:SDR family NAD(P)-dependent oxidoreductase [Usitatibacter palustris]|uniref:2-dehydro-3-deoxy-L-rhamnonate dehydrogenase (NAD(+)) n=1 Tax=Usitatibacter palustris TaxID=2732487 RepID=A0A6M4H8S9_9PROT|nr:SDR family NAD(P)-dependent oxidoreductase [Usitatibacter palustris]QJR14784.1 2-dehydro-3-deoxy-L-rhamnonate dehydrogenase (NAD(+)) [Usitatibacter palustris]